MKLSLHSFNPRGITLVMVCRPETGQGAPRDVFVCDGFVPKAIPVVDRLDHRAGKPPRPQAVRVQPVLVPFP